MYPTTTCFPGALLYPEDGWLMGPYAYTVRVHYRRRGRRELRVVAARKKSNPFTSEARSERKWCDNQTKNNIYSDNGGFCIVNHMVSASWASEFGLLLQIWCSTDDRGANAGTLGSPCRAKCKTVEHTVNRWSRILLHGNKKQTKARAIGPNGCIFV